MGPGTELVFQYDCLLPTFLISFHSRTLALMVDYGEKAKSPPFSTSPKSWVEVDTNHERATCEAIPRLIERVRSVGGGVLCGLAAVESHVESTPQDRCETCVHSSPTLAWIKSSRTGPWRPKILLRPESMSESSMDRHGLAPVLERSRLVPTRSFPPSEYRGQWGGDREKRYVHPLSNLASTSTFKRACPDTFFRKYRNLRLLTRRRRRV